VYLTRHHTVSRPRWACDGQWLPEGFRLSWLLELPADAARNVLAQLPRSGIASGPLLAPIEPEQEVWAAGVTYLRSRDARMAEAQVKDIYWRVYEAERPELFFKGQGWRMAGPGEPVRVRRDSGWNVPEPELAVVFTRTLEIVGYTVGTTSPRVISKGRIRSTSHRRKSTTVPVRSVRVSSSSSVRRTSAGSGSRWRYGGARRSCSRGRRRPTR